MYCQCCYSVCNSDINLVLNAHPVERPAHMDWNISFAPWMNTSDKVDIVYLMMGLTIILQDAVWPKYYGSSPNSFWETGLNAKTWQKLQSQWTIKSGSRLNTDGRVDLNTSKYLHDPSSMALALVVSKKVT